MRTLWSHLVAICYTAPAIYFEVKFEEHRKVLVQSPSKSQILSPQGRCNSASFLLPLHVPQFSSPLGLCCSEQSSAFILHSIPCLPAETQNWSRILPMLLVVSGIRSPGPLGFSLGGSDWFCTWLPHSHLMGRTGVPSASYSNFFIEWMQVTLCLILVSNANLFPSNLWEQMCPDCIVDYKMPISKKAAADWKDSI